MVEKVEIGDYVIVTLKDGTILEGMIVKKGEDNLVVDDVHVHGDWVFIENFNILGLNKLGGNAEGWL